MRRVLGRVRLPRSAVGICFALRSSRQELGCGAVAEPLAALVLGIARYLAVGRPKRE